MCVCVCVLKCETDQSIYFHSSLPLLSITLTELTLLFSTISTNRCLSLVQSLPKKISCHFSHNVFMLGWYIHFEKFAYATLANSCLRPCFILNWSAAMFLFFSWTHPFCMPGIYMFTLPHRVSHLLIYTIVSEFFIMCFILRALC